MFVLIGAGLSSFLWAVSAGKAGAWPLVIFALGAGVTAYLGSDAFTRTPLDLALVIFLGTAMIGVWAAYDRDAAQQKFWLLVGASLVAYAIAIQPPQNMWTTAALLARTGLIVALAFLVLYSIQTSSIRFNFISQLTKTAPGATLTPAARGLQPSVFGGAMAVLLPFQMAHAAHAWQRQHRRDLIVDLASLAIIILALWLAAERSIVLALATGLSLALLWQKVGGKYASRGFLSRKNLRRFLLALFALFALFTTLVVLVVERWQAIQLVDRLAGFGSAMGRAQLASQTLDLIADFPFTGGGLASFPGLHARYILGIPYHFLQNGHNVLLDVTLEQGILATLILLLVMASAAWRLAWLAVQRPAAHAGRDRTMLAAAALGSVLILLLHGMVEDAIYGSPASPLLFVAPALAMMLNRPTGSSYRSQVKHGDRLTAAVFAVAMLAFVGAMLTPQGRAAWQANLGAVNMARLELQDFPTDRWVETAPDAALADAQRRFETSLRLNPGQRTARYRLGLLAMQRDDFERATAHLQVAHTQDSHHIGVRKALGYSYAWSGDLARAGELLATTPFVAQELDAYITWWRDRGRNDLADAARQIRASFQSQDNQMIVE